MIYHVNMIVGQPNILLKIFNTHNLLFTLGMCETSGDDGLLGTQSSGLLAGTPATPYLVTWVTAIGHTGHTGHMSGVDTVDRLTVAQAVCRGG